MQCIQFEWSAVEFLFNAPQNIIKMGVRVSEGSD